MFSRLSQTLSRRSPRRSDRPHAVRCRRPRFEPLEARQLLTSVPFGATEDDTAEFMLGSVLVTVVLMESDGTIDANLEDWNPTTIQEVKDSVTEGLQWWEDTLAAQGSVHTLDFTIDFTYADAPVATGYEPISRQSQDYALWVEDFLDHVGYDTSASLSSDIRAFNHAQREAFDTNWAFTIFVANSDADADDKFNASGDFRGAFAFAGGRFFVTPSKREGQTIAHETTHMFWARDEYAGSGSYDDQRGYYNTQNVNAIDDRPFGAPALVDSLMQSGALWDAAYANNTSSPSSLAMIGWQDSDGDGIFDVLDVPHTLNGVGWFDDAADTYHFQGAYSVGTLPNVNSSGLQNDITINRVSRIEYRLDGGAWTTAASPDDYANAELDLQIGPLGTFSEIEIRTIDDATGITSPVFSGFADRMSQTAMPGINGFAFNDTNGNGAWDDGEPPLVDWTVQVLDGAGQELPELGRVEPDFFTDGTVLTPAQTPGVTLSAIGSGVSDGTVSARNQSTASTGTRTFSAKTTTSWSSVFTPANSSSSRLLRIDFDSPVTSVTLDAVGRSAANQGRLDIYDADDNLLARYTTAELGTGEVETMTLSWPTAEIAYAVAGGHGTSGTRLDNLRWGVESTTTTGSHGEYTVGYLPPGDYQVEIVAPAGWSVSTPGSEKHDVTLAGGEAVDLIDFGAFQTSVVGWQNPTNRFDVSNDGFVSPIDALQVINDLNENQSRPLPAPIAPNVPPPFIDVNGDGWVSPIDALQVINLLNASNAEVGNLVWLDLNGNGLREDGEPGMGGVALQLFRDGDTQSIATTTSDDNGRYRFVGIPEGDYYVQATAPADHVISLQDIGDDDAIDSDAAQDDGTTPLEQVGRTHVFSLIEDQVEDSIDIGILKNFTVIVESVSVQGSSSVQVQALIDVTFDIPAPIAPKLAGYTIYADVTPTEAGITFGAVQEAANPVFPGLPPDQITEAGLERFDQILPGSFSETTIEDGMSLFRIVLDIAPDTFGTYQVDLPDVLLAMGGEDVHPQVPKILNYVVQPGVLTITPPGAPPAEGEFVLPPATHPRFEPLIAAEGAPDVAEVVDRLRQRIDLPVLDDVFARIEAHLDRAISPRVREALANVQQQATDRLARLNSPAADLLARLSPWLFDTTPVS